MPSSSVSDQIRDFVLQRIDSVVQIEALLLIRSNPEVRLSAAQVAERLYVGRAQADQALDGLCASGLLIRIDDGYSLEGVPRHSRALIDELLDLYRQHLIPVTNIVHSKPRRAASRTGSTTSRKVT